MVFDPSSRQIAKTTVWASPPDQGASFDKVLLRLAFWGKNYEGFFPFGRLFNAFGTFPPSPFRLGHFYQRLLLAGRLCARHWLGDSPRRLGNAPL